MLGVLGVLAAYCCSGHSGADSVELVLFKARV